MIRLSAAPRALMIFESRSGVGYAPPGFMLSPAPQVEITASQVNSQFAPAVLLLFGYQTASNGDERSGARASFSKLRLFIAWVAFSCDSALNNPAN